MLFAATVGQVLNEVLGDPPRSANLPGKSDRDPVPDEAPDRGPPFQDDIYLWSHNKRFLQTKLDIMVRSLRARNLKVNAAKTKYIHTQEGNQAVKVGDNAVKGAKDGTVTVLGAPVALAGEVVQILAEPEERGGPSLPVGNCSQEVWTVSCLRTLGTWPPQHCGPSGLRILTMR